MNRRTKKIVFISLSIVVAGIVLVAFVNKKNKTMIEKYLYGTGPVAPRMYPVKPTPAYLLYKKNEEWNNALMIADREIVEAGLADIGSSYLRDEFGLPVGVDAVWLSEAERKFYEIEARFDGDTMSQLFKQGYNDFEKRRLKNKEGKEVDSVVSFKQGYHQVNIGFIPGGKIVVYLRGYGFCREVGIYQGKETKVDLNKWGGYPEGTYQDSNFQKDLNAMIDRWYNELKDDKTTQMQLSHWKQYGVPLGLWDKYFERFNYERTFEFEQKDTVYSTTVDVECFNAEHFDDKFNLINPAARPTLISLSWKYDTTMYTAYCFFEEAEVMRIFEEAYGNDRNQKGEMLFKVGKYNNKLDISLKVGDKEYPFKKVKMDIYKETIGNHESAHRIYSNKWEYGFLRNPYTYIGL